MGEAVVPGAKVESPTLWHCRLRRMSECGLHVLSNSKLLPG